MEEIKPIPNQNTNNRRKYLKISIPLAVMVALVGGVFFTVNNAQQQQDNRSQASLGTNMVTNEGFESGTGGWYFWTRSGSGSFTTTSSNYLVGARSGQVTVSSTGSVPHDIELAQYGKAYTAGQTYTVSFAAKASTSRTIDIVTQDGTSPYREYMRKQAALTTSWQRFSYTFVPSETKPNGLIGFQFGRTSGTFWIDDVRISTGTSTTSPQPTVASGTGTSATLTPIADAVVYQSSSSSNHGTKTVLEFETEYGGTDYSYLKFDLRPYVGKTITSAKLRLRTNGDSDAGSTGTSSVKVVSDTSWSETGITYNNRPTISSTTLGSFTPRYSNTLYETTLNPSGLQYAVGNLLSLGVVNPTDDGVTVHSRESSYDPELVLTFAQTSVPTQAPTATSVPTQAPTATTAPSATAVPSAIPTATPTPAPGVTVTVAPTAVATTVPSPTQTQPANTPAPTATPVPGSTTANVTLLMHGLGKGGDAVNPNSQGNFNPIHPQRTVTFDVYDVQNQLVMTKQGTVSFNTQTGAFSGNIDLGAQFTSGIYTVKVKTDQYLRGLMSGIQTITQGQVNTMPSVTLVAGDVNNDNAINIVDYNILVGCYSDLLPPVSCNDINLVRADLNDDSFVNQFDYNLFIRELTNIGGQ